MRGALAAVLCACALACGIARARIHGGGGDDGGEAEISPMPFVFARYGRSPERLIAQRNEKWAMTTRYGKRAATELSMEGPPCPPSGRRGGLCCAYTGFLSLYTCTGGDCTQE